MAGHMAVEEPNSGVVRHHVSDDAHHRGQHDHVHAHMGYGGRLPVPMRGVDVPGLLLIGIGEQIHRTRSPLCTVNMGPFPSK